MPLVPAEPKLARQSVTIWVFVTQLVAALTTLILHYTGALEVDGSVLGGAWTGALSAVAGIVLRLVTKQPIGPSSGSTLVSIVFLALVAVPLVGCATTARPPGPLPPPLQVAAPFECRLVVTTPSRTHELDLVETAEAVVADLLAVSVEALERELGAVPPLLVSIAAGAANYGTAEGLCRAFEAVAGKVSTDGFKVQVLRLPRDEARARVRPQPITRATRVWRARGRCG